MKPEPENLTLAHEETPASRTDKGVGSTGGSGLPAFFDRFPNAVSCQRIRGGIIFHWSRKGIGHGMLTLRVNRGKLEVDDERMNSDFCAAVVKQAIDEASRTGTRQLTKTA